MTIAVREVDGWDRGVEVTWCVGGGAGAVEVVEVGVRHGRHCVFVFFCCSEIGWWYVGCSCAFWCCGCRRLNNGRRGIKIVELYMGEKGGKQCVVFIKTMVPKYGNIELRFLLDWRSCYHISLMRISRMFSRYRLLSRFRKRM